MATINQNTAVVETANNISRMGLSSEGMRVCSLKFLILMIEK